MQARLPEVLPEVEFVEDGVAIAHPALTEFFAVLDALGHGRGGEAFATLEEAVAVADEVGLGDEGEGAAGLAAGCLGGGSGERRVNSALEQRRLDGVAGNMADIDAPAAADDRLEELFRGGRDEDESGMRWRLFERLEEAVGGIEGDALRRVDDDDAVAGFVGEAGDEFDGTADLAKADIARVGVTVVAALGLGPAKGIAGSHEEDIGVSALEDEAAGAAGSAGLVRRTCWPRQIKERRARRRRPKALAIEQERVFAGEDRASGVDRTDQEQGVWGLRPEGEHLELPEDCFMADDSAHPATLASEAGKEKRGKRARSMTRAPGPARIWGAGWDMRTFVLGIVLFAAVGAGGSLAAPADPGPIDQQPLGAPACTAEKFPNSSIPGTPLRQEFRPSSIGLLAVDLCIETGAQDTDVAVFIREGTALQPGSYVGGHRETVAANTLGYVSFAFRHILYIPKESPQTTYVIETVSNGAFRWRAAPEFTDIYPLGRSNRPDELDYGFRTRWAVPPGLPSGQAEQALRKDPPCNDGALRGFGTLTTPLYQSFVPGKDGIAAVDLCVETLVSDQRIALNLRQGTAPSPGGVIATGSAVAEEPGIQWVRITFAKPVRVTPGQSYVLEVPESSAFRWRSSCPGLGAGCFEGEVDPDLYPAGSAPDGRDYGFRTIAGAPGGWRLTAGMLARQ